MLIANVSIALSSWETLIWSFIYSQFFKTQVKTFGPKTVNGEKTMNIKDVLQEMHDQY